MTPEQKVALLKEAGVWDVIGYPTCIDRLFDLVASHEREHCAKLFEEESANMMTKQECAAAIRARGEK